VGQGLEYAHGLLPYPETADGGGTMTTKATKSTTPRIVLVRFVRFVRFVIFVPRPPAVSGAA
jgi:hypothetical protein